MRLAIAFVLTATTAAGPAWASQADVCYSTPVSSSAPDRLTAATALDCPIAGRRSLTQLAQAGWSVASVAPIVTDYTLDPASKTPQSMTSWMLVVEKEAK